LTTLPEGRNPDFVRFLVEAKVLKFGKFILKSGDPSPFFINLGDLSSGQTLQRLGEFLAREILLHFPDVTHLFGPAYKGISMATATATALYSLHGRNTEVFFDRKEAKAHGEGGNYIGSLPDKNSRVLIIDDVVSSGGTKLSAIGALERDFGNRPLGILVGVDRTRVNTDLDREALGLRSVIDVLDIAGYLKRQSDERWETIVRFYQEL